MIVNQACSCEHVTVSGDLIELLIYLADGRYPSILDSDAIQSTWVGGVDFECDVGYEVTGITLPKYVELIGEQFWVLTVEQFEELREVSGYSFRVGDGFGIC